jgi:hypothetical protein
LNKSYAPLVAFKGLVGGKWDEDAYKRAYEAVKSTYVSYKLLDDFTELAGGENYHKQNLPFNNPNAIISDLFYNRVFQQK